MQNKTDLSTIKIGSKADDTLLKNFTSQLDLLDGQTAFQIYKTSNVDNFIFYDINFTQDYPKEKPKEKASKSKTKNN